MPHPVAEADLQPVELQFASKWIGLISSWCNRKHLLPYLIICKKSIHLAVTFSHTQGKKTYPEDRKIFWEFQYAALCLHCSTRQRARAIATETAGILALKTSRWFLCYSTVSRWKQLSFRDSDKWGPGTGNTWLGSFLFCCALSCFISLYFCKLKE